MALFGHNEVNLFTFLNDINYSEHIFYLCTYCSGYEQVLLPEYTAFHNCLCTLFICIICLQVVVN